MPKEPTTRASFTASERAFVWTMFQAGVAASDAWLEPEQRAMAARIAPALHALPLARPRSESKAAPGRKPKAQSTAEQVAAAMRQPVAAPAHEADPFEVPAQLRRG